MKKISLILIIACLLIFPFRAFAQDVIDFLDQLINEGTMEEDFDANNPAAADQLINLKSLELIWYTDSYVPYDYPGRALASEDGFITVETILETEGGNPANLQYSWFVDNRFEEEKSGYGKKNFSFGVRRGAQSSHIILVKIFDDAGSFYAEKSVTIPLVAPEIVIYTYGGNAHFSAHSKNYSTVLSDKKISFIARPFFFGIKKLTDLSFEWRIAQNKITANSANNAILDLTLKGKEDKKEFEENLNLLISNKAFTEQKALKNVLLKIY